MRKQTATTKNATRSSRTGTNGHATRTRSTSSQTANADLEQYSSPLERLFTNLLQDIYSVEKHLVDALGNFQALATTEELQDAFEDHRFATEKHAARLEKVFSLMGMKPQKRTCATIEAIISEANELISQTEEGSMTRDVALVISAQKAEHYEIASYGSLVELALTLGNDKVAFILEKTLLEEEDTDLLLTDIAECAVNPWADEEPAEILSEYEEEALV
jgi:ferritin-like metal-binding protein YciE